MTTPTPLSLMERLDHLTSIPPEYRRVDPPAPPSVKVELTSRCNYACSFCAKKSKLRVQGDMEYDEFIRIAIMLRKAGVNEIGLFYLGESFLVPWLEDAIGACKEMGYPYVFLTTNGSLATPDRLEACMASGLDSLKFSLNWADAEQFEQVACVKSRLWEQATANILQSTGIRDRGRFSTKIYGSYIIYDDAQAERMRAYVERIRSGVDEVYELPLYTQAAHIAAQDAPEAWRFSPGNQGRAACKRPPVPCWALFTEGHVTWDSKLAACCFDHDGRFEMGDLTNKDFMDAWHSPAFMELRNGHLRGDVTDTVCGPCVVG